MKVHEGGLAGGLGVEARRAHRHTLVQMHDVLDLGMVEERVEQRALGGPRIAEDAVDAVVGQRLHEDLASAHFANPQKIRSLVLNIPLPR